MERILNCLPSQKVENDWQYETAVYTKFLIRDLPLPPSMDLRRDWWEVNDQADTGSCVGWAVADSLLRWLFVEKGLLKPEKLLSARFIWMASKEIDELNHRPTTFIEMSGTNLKSALDVARNYGCVTDRHLSFDKVSSFNYEEDLFYAYASKYKILNYFNLHSGDKIENWKEWIGYGSGPVLTRLIIDKSWNDVETSGSVLENYAPYEKKKGGHAVAIVGYTEDDYFIVRNSWGKEWGKDGYILVSKQYAELAFTESYGVSVR